MQEVKEAPRATKVTTSPPAEYEDLVKAGVVDPKKVTRSAALQNAASIAGLLLTYRMLLITDAPEKEQAPATAAVTGHGGGMGDMGGMGGY